MSGYVAVKRFRQNPKSTKNKHLEIKRQFVCSVLKTMKADSEGQVCTDDVESLEDYTLVWSELIDNGGLYHVNDQASYTFTELANHIIV